MGGSAGGLSFTWPREKKNNTKKKTRRGSPATKWGEQDCVVGLLAFSGEITIYANWLRPGESRWVQVFIGSLPQLGAAAPSDMVAARPHHYMQIRSVDLICIPRLPLKRFLVGCLRVAQKASGPSVTSSAACAEWRPDWSATNLHMQTRAANANEAAPVWGRPRGQLLPSLSADRPAGPARRWFQTKPKRNRR